MKFVDELLKKLREPILKVTTGFICALILIFGPVCVTMIMAIISGNTEYALVFATAFTTSSVCLGLYSWLWLKKIPQERR